MLVETVVWNDVCFFFKIYLYEYVEIERLDKNKFEDAITPSLRRRNLILESNFDFKYPSEDFPNRSVDGWILLSNRLISWRDDRNVND